jgi:hypothetical protein
MSLLFLCFIGIEGKAQHIPNPDTLYEYNSSLETRKNYYLRYSAIASNNSGPTETLKTAVKGWMKNIPDDTKLNKISIPGTHDSGAEDPEPIFTATQSWTIKQQLEAGIRFFDIRIRQNDNNNAWDVYHTYDLELTFDQVLSQMEAFLGKPENFYEGIIMNLQKDGDDDDHGKYDDIWDTYSARLFRPTTYTTPKMSEIRQKIFCVKLATKTERDGWNMIDQNYYEIWNLVGQDCLDDEGDCPFLDCWGASSNCATIEGKERAVKDYINKAKNSTIDTNWYVNYLSGSVHMEPGPVAKRTNKVAYEYFNTVPAQTAIGTIIMDFPGEGLIYRIIKTNFNYEKRIEIYADIDCYDNVDNEETNDKIEVVFFNGTEELGSVNKKPDCDWSEDATYSLSADVTATEISQDVTHIEIRTEGGDAFAVDELYLMRKLESENGTDWWVADKELHKWGTEGNNAWCLSTEDDDLGSYTDGCHKCIRFEVVTGKAYKCSSKGTDLMQRVESYRVNSTPRSQQSYLTSAEKIYPIAECKDITVELEDNGQVLIQASELDNGSFDPVSSSSLLHLSADITTFTCDDIILSPISVTLTVNNGLVATCISEVSVIDDVDKQPIVYLGPDQTFCTDESTVLDAENPGASYVWSTGVFDRTIEVNTTGTYSVAVTNIQGCVNSDEINITVNPLPVIDLGNIITDCDVDHEFDAGTPGSTYLWSTGEVGQTIQASEEGNYIVTVTNVYGCVDSDEAVLVESLGDEAITDFSSENITDVVYSGTKRITPGNHSGSLAVFGGKVILDNANFSGGLDVYSGATLYVCGASSINENGGTFKIHPGAIIKVFGDLTIEGNEFLNGHIKMMQGASLSTDGTITSPSGLTLEYVGFSFHNAFVDNVLSISNSNIISSGNTVATQFTCPTETACFDEVIVNDDECSEASYVAGNAYSNGDHIQNIDNLYYCKVGGWCSGASWAYEPGVGVYWSMAWDFEGACDAQGGFRKRSSDAVVNNNELVKTATLLFYPNPATDIVNIKFTSELQGAINVSIVNLVGQVIFSKNTYKVNEELKLAISTANILSGTYSIVMKSNNTVLQKKVVIQH